MRINTDWWWPICSKKCKAQCGWNRLNRQCRKKGRLVHQIAMLWESQNKWKKCRWKSPGKVSNAEMSRWSCPPEYNAVPKCQALIFATWNQSKVSNAEMSRWSCPPECNAVPKCQTWSVRMTKNVQIGRLMPAYLLNELRWKMQIYMIRQSE